jgi:hypothetical protein
MLCWPAPTSWPETYELDELAIGLDDLFEECQAWKRLDTVKDLTMG